MPKETDNQPHWYVADVNPKFEKRLVASLARDGIEYFTPVQKTIDISGKKHEVISTPLSPGLVYIHCTESQPAPFYPPKRLLYPSLCCRQ